MDFQTKKIRSDRVIKTHDNLEKAKKGAFAFIKANLIAFIIIAVFIWGMCIAAAKILDMTENSISVKNIILSVISSSLATDEEGHTNFLLLGMGGGSHDGAELTDTIMVASLDKENNLVPMLSIPRDFYIEDELIGNWRINRFYELTKMYHENQGRSEEEARDIALSALKEKIAELLDIEIHYYALVDFNGFIDIVDALGGIDVYLDENFYDPYYPIEETGQYQTFYLDAGENHFDGEDALKFARSRKTTSDFDRALRQQQIIAALKDKAFSLGVLASPGKLKNLYEAFSSNFVTNLTFTEIARLGKMADDFSQDSILSQVFSDDPYATGGFLYTPDRELYGGAFVLVPSSYDYSEIQHFAELFLHTPGLFKENIPLQVVNSSGYEGLATDTKNYLNRYGLYTARYGNAARLGLEETTIFNLSGEESKTLDLLLELIPEAEVSEIIPEDYLPENWPTEAQLLIELGKDFIPYYEENNETRFYYWQYIPPAETEEAAEEGETAEADSSEE